MLPNCSDGGLNIRITKRMNFTPMFDLIELVKLGGEDIFEHYFRSFSLTMCESLGWRDVGIAHILEQSQSQNLRRNNFAQVNG